MLFRRATKKEVSVTPPQVVSVSHVGSNDILIVTIKDMNELQYKGIIKVLNGNPDFIVCDQDYSFKVLHFDDREKKLGAVSEPKAPVEVSD